jgi:Protein of unknown function (DUF2752)
MRPSGRAIDLGLAGLAAVQLGAAAWLLPAGDRLTLPDGTPLPGLCPVRAALSIDCPLCGMSRSFVALAHGDLGAAIGFHPAGPLLFAAMVVFVAAAVVVALRRARPLVERRRFLFAFEAVALVCLVIGVFKTVRS